MRIMKTDITGRKYGKLTVVSYNKELGKWECKCDCGNITFVKAYSLNSGHTKSCGCIIKETSAINGRKALLDLSGKHFGKLTAIEYNFDKKQWLCKCTCGNFCYVSQNNLCRKEKGTKSCGCISDLAEANKKNINFDTNIGNIRNETETKRSTTGVRGVYYRKSTNTYIAQITFQKKTYHLCSSKDVRKCITARKIAEEHIHKGFLDWYDKWEQANSIERK